MAGQQNYTDKAIQNHEKTYRGFLTLLKVGIATCVVALLILVVVYNA